MNRLSRRALNVHNWPQGSRPRLPVEASIALAVAQPEPPLARVCLQPLPALHAVPDGCAVVCSTACTPLAHDQVDQRSRVKCIVDQRGYAMYFSRSPLPGNKDGMARPPLPNSLAATCCGAHAGMPADALQAHVLKCSQPSLHSIMRSLPGAAHNLIGKEQVGTL